MCSSSAILIVGRTSVLRLADTAPRDHGCQPSAQAGYGDDSDAPAYSGLKGQGSVLIRNPLLNDECGYRAAVQADIRTQKEFTFWVKVYICPYRFVQQP